MAVSQLGYLGFGISDPEAWAKYATEVLGLEVSERTDDTIYLRMDEYHHRISLHPGGNDDVAYIGLACRNKEEYEDTKAKLFEGGIEYVQSSEAERANRHVRDMVKFKAAGIPLEVYYGPHVLFEMPFRPSARISGFKTGDMGLGHIGVNADDFEEMSRILKDCLGFRVSDSLGNAERFFHCNPREHTFVIGGQPFKEGDKRIGHFMLELQTLDDVGSGLDRVEDAGVQISSRLGKHTNDHMISFYMFTPSGFRLEYGWNGRQVNDDVWMVNDYKKASIWGHRRPLDTAAAPPVSAR